MNKIAVAFFAMTQAHRHHKHISAGALLAAAVAPAVASAQDSASADMEILNTVTLWSALVLGVVASAMVLSMARVMRGGLFGSVLTYFGLGMALVVGSFFAITIPQWTYPEVVKSVHDVVFIFGYVLMGIGAWKLQRGIPSAARGRNVSRQSDEAAGQP